MFEPSAEPRIFGVAPGADFPKAVVSGLLERLQSDPPEALARVQIFVNTRRMQRRIKDLFDDGSARLLPRIRLVTDLALEAALGDIPAPVSPLRRRLELTQLVAQLLKAEPDLAPSSSLFDLADSLAAVMDELQGEGIAPSALEHLDVTDQSGHWQRSLRFLRLVDRFMAADAVPDTESRQRRVVEALTARWVTDPPSHPILVAGSTGSRGTTSMLMQAVARLPQGALILPGFDFDLHGNVWAALKDPRCSEDHPQFRFSKLLSDLQVGPATVGPWTGKVRAPSPARNRLVSLALRPAPVTDQWKTEGARLTDLSDAARPMSLIEAPSPRGEATAIALILRDAVERGVRSALITPDRVLTRQVTAALDRWGLVPDDSAGRPLPQTAPGRFLRQVAALFGEPLTVEALLALLKHPLTASTQGLRGRHLLASRELELSLRRNGPPRPTADHLRSWSRGQEQDVRDWGDWLADTLGALHSHDTLPLAVWLDRHIAVASRLAAGPASDGSGALWHREAGREALRWVQSLQQEADAGGMLTARDYADLFDAVLQRGEVREATGPHPNVMIWGTLEARVQGADLIVLGGLNEGTWPEAPAPDPWLNRSMRYQAGLLLPERRIGLAAHDFQQAVGAPEVVLSRALRGDEARTVPSRWLNRLTNLMSGLSEDSRAALASMRDRGRVWLARAAALDRPVAYLPPAPRPCPSPPIAKRPRQLSITEIERLIRDPYAIYARHVLRLKPLDPLRQRPDAPLRGTILHRVLETFIESGPVAVEEEATARLMSVCDAVLTQRVPWPAAQRMWRARLARVSGWFVRNEIARQAAGTVLAAEVRGTLPLPGLNVTLVGKLDRIDQNPDGRATIYDYKTGSPPSDAVQEHFDKQLGLAAMLAEAGALDDMGPFEVAQTVYIGLGSSPKESRRDWSTEETGHVRDGLIRLLAAYGSRARGYTARRAMQELQYGGDFDHLARYGEWDETVAPVLQEVGSCS